jgi:hypothetical protein
MCLIDWMRLASEDTQVSMPSEQTVSFVARSMSDRISQCLSESYLVCLRSLDSGCLDSLAGSEVSRPEALSVNLPVRVTCETDSVRGVTVYQIDGRGGPMEDDVFLMV